MRTRPATDDPELLHTLGRVYDVLGERGGRWIRVRTGIADIADAQQTVTDLRFGSPSITWHILCRTTTVTEAFADDLLPPT